VPTRADEASAAKVRDLEAKFGPPGIQVPKPVKPPLIDGWLDDACWKQVAPITLGRAAGGWEPLGQKTEARVLADEQAIYFAVRCFDDQPKRLLSAEYPRLGQVNTGDTVEIFLDPGHTESRLRYYRLVVNPKGIFRTFADGGRSNWAPGMTVKVRHFEGGWTVEASVSMLSFGLVKGRIPKVWGLNICRQRAELGVVRPRAPTGKTRLDPMVRRLDVPEDYRDGEYSAWSPTWLDYNYNDSQPFSVPERFGHALLDAGTVEVAPPAKLFDVIYQARFDKEMGSFANGVLVEGGFRGPGKCLSSKPTGKSTLYLRHPLHELQDATLIMTFRLPKKGRLYYYGRSPDDWQCGACRHEVFLTAEAVAERRKARPHKGLPLFPTFDLYDTHADKMAWKSWGRAWKGTGPWTLITGYFSEPSMGSVMYPGSEWAILRIRLGAFRRYPGRSPVNPRIPGQSLVPDSQSYPNGLVFFADSHSLQIGDLIIFRGTDVEPPQRAGKVRIKTAQDLLELSWDRARDNTLTAFYRVYAGKQVVAETHQLWARIPRAKVGKQPLSVVAYDLYSNASPPALAKSEEF
jgi:hypothetical protein